MPHGASHVDWYIDGQNCRLAWPGTGVIKAWPDEARPDMVAPINYCRIVSVLVDQYASPTFFYSLAFSSKFHIYTLRIEKPSLDPGLGSVIYGVEVTHLDAIGHGTEVGGHGWRGWRRWR